MLSKNEQIVFCHALTQASATAEDLAKQCGLKAHTVRRSLERLFDREIFIRRSIIANLSVLGLFLFRAYISLIGVREKERNAFRERVKNSEYVTLFGELGGDVQFDIEFFSSSIHEASLFLADIANDYQGALQIHSLQPAGSFRLFGCRRWSPNPEAIQSISFDLQPPSYILDELDHHVLSGLANREYRTLQQLSRQIEVPISTLTYRMERMENAGVIAGYYYVYNPQPANLLPFRILLRPRGWSKQFDTAVREFCQKSLKPHYLESFLGEYSHSIYVSAENYEEASEFAQELTIALNNDLLSVSILPQLRFHKYSAYPCSSLIQPSK